MIANDLILIAGLIISVIVIIVVLHETTKCANTPPMNDKVEIPQPPNTPRVEHPKEPRKIRVKSKLVERIIRRPTVAFTTDPLPIIARAVIQTGPLAGGNFIARETGTDNILHNITNWALDENIITEDSAVEKEIRSDPQNTHDTQVNRIIKKNLEILNKLYDKEQSSDVSIEYYLSRRKYTRDEELFSINLDDIRKKLLGYHEIKIPVLYFGYTPDHALNLAWQRSEDRKNRGNSSNIKEAILSAILDPKHVCGHGKLSSVIGALDGLDAVGDLSPVVSQQITKYMVSDTAGLKYRELLKEISGNRNLDDRIRCAALDLGESQPDLDCDSLTDEERKKGNDALKHRVRPRLHLELEKIYGEEYKHFKNDIDSMIDML